MSFWEIFSKGKESKDWSKVKKDILNCEDINELLVQGGSRLYILLRYGGPFELIKLALEKGANTNLALEKGTDTNLALDHNSNHNYPTSLFYANRAKLDIIELLLKHGANVNFQLSSGQTIFTSTPFASIEFYKTIGNNGYDFSRIDNYGNNILHYSMALRQHDSLLAQYILKKCKNANLMHLLNQKNKQQLTPLHMVSDFLIFDTIKLYIENGADPNVPLSQEFISRNSRVFFENGNSQFEEIKYQKGMTVFDMIKLQREEYDKFYEIGMENTTKGENITKIEKYLEGLKK